MSDQTLTQEQKEVLLSLPETDNVCNSTEKSSSFISMNMAFCHPTKEEKDDIKSSKNPYISMNMAFCR